MSVTHGQCQQPSTERSAVVKQVVVRSWLGRIAVEFGSRSAVERQSNRSRTVVVKTLNVRKSGTAAVYVDGCCGAVVR